MTANEAKRDCAMRLTSIGVPFEKLTAKQLSFEDLARATVFKVTVHGATIPWAYDELKAKLAMPKPSECGYMLDWAVDCKWNTGEAFTVTQNDVDAGNNIHPNTGQPLQAGRYVAIVA